MAKKEYGQMISFDAAIEWAKRQPDSTIKTHALARMEYERDKAIPVKPKFHKGLYGHKYDSYTCGNCGSTINEAHWRYCPNCGFAIGGKD